MTDPWAQKEMGVRTRKIPLNRTRTDGEAGEQGGQLTLGLWTTEYLLHGFTVNLQQPRVLSVGRECLR